MKQQVRLLSLKLGSNHESRGVIERLRTLIPGVWIAGVEESLSVKDSAFDVVVTSHFDALFGTYKNANLTSLAMTPEIYRHVAPFEGQALNMLERVRFHSSAEYPSPRYGVPRYKDSYDSRADLFTRHCLFWHHIFVLHDINAVISHNFGHQGFDFVALSLAQSMGLPTLIFNEASQFPQVQFIQEKVEDLGNLQLGELLKSQVLDQLKTESPDFITKSHWWIKSSPDRARNPEVSRPIGPREYKTSIWSSWLNDSNVWENSEFSILKVLGSLTKKVHRLARHPDRSLGSLPKTLNRTRQTQKSLREEKRFSVPLKDSHPYIFFPLNYQPEASTSAKGRNFYRLREAVAFVANNLPSGWKVVVKEHPHQFRRMYPRASGFYAQICAIPNVHLVPHHSDNNELLKDSRAVVTVSHSSITAHSLAINKSVICLGHSHFREAPNHFNVANSDELKSALEAIDKPTHSDPTSSDSNSAYNRYLSRLRNSTFEGVLAYRPQNLSDSEYFRLVSITQHNLSLVIAAWLRTHGFAA